MRRLLFLFLFGLFACAGGAGRSHDSPLSDSKIIDATEIENTGQFKSAFELVEKLRPNWLRSRGPATLGSRTGGQVMVYMDGVFFGGVLALRQIAVEHVAQIERLTGPEATTRYGTDHAAGALLVRTRRQ